ncbi:MAG: CPBP family intramembrane metalloprotease [Acidobacteria bacterium]|nr:CPBP family intramembrane metalloprotease [Acidobacteriota bacterium]
MMQAPGQPRPSITRVIVFFVAFVFSGEVVSALLGWLGLSDFNGPIVESGAYAFLLLPLVYWADPRVFTKELWRLPIHAWAGVVALAVLQVFINSIGPNPSLTKYRIFSAILVAPIIEEMARAAMQCTLLQRIGVFWAVVTTATLWATAHAHFWIALPQQLALSVIFVSCRKSLPATIIAHLVMNILAIVGFELSGLHP